MTQLALEHPGGTLEEVVTRWIAHDRVRLDEVLPRFSHPAVRLDGVFTRSSRFAHPTWVAHGHLVPVGRLRRRGIRIEITVTAWSDDVAEVNVRRSGRRVLAWSRAREHRYFELAHLAALEISDMLVV